MYGDTGRVDLYKAGVSEPSALAVSLDSSCTVTAHGVGGEEVSVAVTTGSEADGVSGVALELACHEVLGDDATAAAVDDDDILDLRTRVELHGAVIHLFHERRISAEQQLLTGLTLSVERTAHLYATERTVGEHAAILTGERNALCHTLVNDVGTDLRQTVDVGLTGTVVTALDGIVEQTVDGITVVLVVLGCIDTALCSDRVCTARRVLDAEVDHVEAHLTEGSSSAGTGQTCTYDDDVKLTLVGGVHQFLVSFIVGPFFGQGAFWNS